MVEDAKKDKAVEVEESAPVDLEAELAQARAQAEEYLDQWRRTAAEFSNYRKRIEREREEMSRFSNALLLGKLLPILDDLERAMATLPPDLHRLSWVEGVALIGHKLWVVVEAEGLKPIEAAGKPFDPEQHEAVLREETADYPDGQVIAELQRGYLLYDRVLRPTLVKVAVAPATPEPAVAAEEGEPPAEKAASSEPSKAGEGAANSPSEQPDG